MESQSRVLLIGDDENDSQLPANQRLMRYLLGHASYELAILKMGGQYVLFYCSGQEVRTKPISDEALRSAFVGEPVDSGWLAEGVKRWGSGPYGTFIVKYIPPGIQTIYLSLDGGNGPTPCTLPLPGLVFAGANSNPSADQGGGGTITYYVWALSEPFNPTARLHHAPFPNVYLEGRICFGDVHVPEVSWKTIEKAWKLFLESRFTFSMVAGKSVRHDGDVRDMLLACQTLSCYPTDDLLPLHDPARQGYAQRGTTVETVNDAVEAYLLKGKDR
jgi:Prokaryotic E2 family D